jgi:cytochrome c peroxidase
MLRIARPGDFRYRVPLPIVLLCTVFAATAHCAEPPKPKLAPLSTQVVAPDDNPSSTAKIDLGKQLFFDPRLSGDNTLSCATCHIPAKGFADGKAASTGSGGAKLKRNTPTVLNSAFLSAYLWDGRAATLEQQALGPIQAADEMNQNLDELERELQSVSGYAKQFEAVFGGPVSRDGIAKALAAFERTLVAPRSPLDRHLAGEKDALSPSARRGMELFTGEAGCIRCHHGPLLSDGKFYRLGVSFRDDARGAVTRMAEDRYKFRTPPLREVARTAPYMHDGSITTLEGVIEFYFRGASTAPPDNLPLDIEPMVGQSYSDIADIAAFLRSLSGEPPDIAPPELP